MVRTKGTSQDDIQERRSVFREVLTEFATKGTTPKRRDIIKSMQKNGYPKYTTHQYKQDWVQEARANTFVRDLTESTFSQHIDEIFDQIMEYEELVRDWMKNPPEILRKKMGNPHRGKMKVIETTTETVSPITIASLGLKLQEVKLKIVTGDACNTSFAIAKAEVDFVKDENQKLKTTIKQLEDQAQ